MPNHGAHLLENCNADIICALPHDDDVREYTCICLNEQNFFLEQLSASVGCFLIKDQEACLIPCSLKVKSADATICVGPRELLSQLM